MFSLVKQGGSKNSRSKSKSRSRSRSREERQEDNSIIDPTTFNRQPFNYSPFLKNNNSPIISVDDFEPKNPDKRTYEKLEKNTWNDAQLYSLSPTEQTQYGQPEPDDLYDPAFFLNKKLEPTFYVEKPKPPTQYPIYRQPFDNQTHKNIKENTWNYSKLFPVESKKSLSEQSPQKKKRHRSSKKKGGKRASGKSPKSNGRKKRTTQKKRAKK